MPTRTVGSRSGAVGLRCAPVGAAANARGRHAGHAPTSPFAPSRSPAPALNSLFIFYALPNMKHFFTFFFCCLWLLPAQSQTISPPPKNGKYPKMEKEWNYPIVNFLPSEKGELKAKRSIDATTGKYTLCEYLRGASPSQQYFYQYDAANRQRSYYWQKSEGQRILEFSEYYNAQNNLLRRFRFRADGALIDSLIYQYDDRQRLSSEKSYDGNGILLYEVQYKYDDERLVATEYHHDHSSKQQFEISIQNNSQGLPVTRKRYTASGTLFDKTEFIRNEQGLVIEKRYYRDGKRLETRELFDYDLEHDRIIWALYSHGGAQLDEYIVFEYMY